MKILVVGDFQGKFPLKLKNKINSIKDEIDFIIGVGDYAGIDEWRPYIMKYMVKVKVADREQSFEEFIGKKKFRALMKKDFEQSKNVYRILNSFGKQVYFVFGNSDDEWYTYPFGGKIWETKISRVNFVKGLKNFISLNYTKRKISGIDFVGFGGYIDIEAYFDKKEWKDDDKKIGARKKRHKNAEKKLFSILRKTKSPRIFVLHYPPYG